MSGPVVLALRALLALGLYAFLAWAFVNLWRDVQQEGTLLSGRRVPPISLTVAGRKPKTRRYTQSEIVIGRDPACECPAEDDSVSARHARLSYHHNQWWLEDLGSMNGTRLNDQLVTMPTVLVSGDEFACGETRILVSMSDRAGPMTTRPLNRKSDEDV